MTSFSAPFGLFLSSSASQKKILVKAPKKNLRRSVWISKSYIKFEVNYSLSPRDGSKRSKIAWKIWICMIPESKKKIKKNPRIFFNFGQINHTDSHLFCIFASFETPAIPGGWMNSEIKRIVVNFDSLITSLDFHQLIEKLRACYLKAGPTMCQRVRLSTPHDAWPPVGKIFEW